MPTSNQATIFVLEDKATVRAIFRLVLESHGFKVLPVDSAREALQQFSRHGDEIDLLIADLTMPDGSVADLVSECSLRSSRLRIILTSSSPPDMWGDDVRRTLGGLVSSRVAILQKPISPGVLIGAVNSLLLTPEEGAEAGL